MRRTPFEIDLTGQTAFVTGASSGLGRHFAQVLAEAGAKVAVVARRADRLDQLVSEIRAKGGDAVAINLDVADAIAVPKAVDTAEVALGPISILINNAARCDVGDSIGQDIATIDDALATNLRAPFLLSREVARRLIAARRPGRIVNIASMGAYYQDGTLPVVMYASTKMAVVKMTELLAIEWAANHINVNAIAPGLFRTEMNAAATEEQLASIAAKMKRGRIGEPRHLASTLLYLVAPQSEFVSGICIKVDDMQFPR